MGAALPFGGDGLRSSAPQTAVARMLEKVACTLSPVLIFLQAR